MPASVESWISTSPFMGAPPGWRSLSGRGPARPGRWRSPSRPDTPAAWRPAGGAIRVALVDEPTGWRACFRTDPSAGVADVLGMAADRLGLEITFRECNQVVGAGRQQVRFVWANIGA